jgi:hypothetical protein
MKITKFFIINKKFKNQTFKIKKFYLYQKKIDQKFKVII